MRSDVASDLSASQAVFLSKVWPMMAMMDKQFADSELIPVESVTEKDFAKYRLDTLAGVDAWHVKSGVGMRGIASRVQWCGSKPWPTFTVRYSRATGAKTEYAKRIEAIESAEGWLYPSITVQAYFKSPKPSDELMSFACANTKDIMLCVRDTPKGNRFSDSCAWYMQVNNYDDNEFAVVKWDGLSRLGCKVLAYQRNP